MLDPGQCREFADTLSFAGPRCSPMKQTVLLPLLATCLAAAQPSTIGEAFSQGTLSANVRARFESVEQTGLRDADALTLRTRVAYTTAAFRGWKAMIEGENVIAADGDSYSQAGINPGGSGRAVIADPESTELNQAWVAFSGGDTTLTVGKQRLVLDNARFVGDVGWRQNMQTFDAVAVQDKSLGKTTLTYAYIDRVYRVFSHRHSQGRWDSDSHLFNASFTGFKAGTLTAYAYFLDFDNSAANSCATYGASFTGTKPLGDDLKLTYRVDLATQRDRGSSPLSYSATYHSVELGVTHKVVSLAIGREVLGSDSGVSFRTPLATLHAFNGWADLFLSTPGNGLRDAYLKGTAVLPEAINLLVFFHWFEADRFGADYGTELDLQLSRKFGKHFTGTAKFAKFERETANLPDVTKFWLQVDYIH